MSQTASGEPLPKTEVPRFEVGHGRPDLGMLHDVVHMLDMGEPTYYVREVVARYLVTRPDDTKETT